MVTKIIIIRHGETKWNRGKVFRGIYDIPLNENGRNQAHLTSEALGNYSFDAAYTSPLSRAYETAEQVLAPHGIKASVDEGFLDMDYGEWTGKSEEEVKQRWPSEYADWLLQPHKTRPPGGTTIKEIFDKSFTALTALGSRHAGQTIAVFSHRVVNKLLIIGALGLGIERFPYII
jgi:broad specificity phosphatase PhoE